MDTGEGVAAGELRRASISLDPEPRSVSMARSFVSTMLETWDCDDPERIVALLTSEIVTNAVKRATGTVRVEAELVSDVALRVEASDDHPDLPYPRRPDPHSEGGRGILLVQELALRWGVDREERHKVVWFEAPVIPRRSRCR
ncbi:MAG TPA: ATP-binding protein [Acidimicrobiales bacterium]|jgi:anti-sigma regulatory factor (Ser/Thr protein kinase)|nr:ATP-binding protein [Acidimicrobiales bacterium]